MDVEFGGRLSCYNGLIRQQSLGIHYNPGNDPFDDVTDPGVSSSADGHVGIPDGPGLGIEVNEDDVRERAAIGHRWRPPGR